MSLQKRELFGGAIELEVPSDFLDVSDFRQVPDTQEVFTIESGDVSLVMEILDVVKEAGSEHDLWKAINFHFGALAHDNEALSQNIVTPAPSTSTLPVHLGSYTTEDDLSSKFETPTPFLLEGIQTVRKFRSDRPTEELPAPDKITILVALWRVLLDNGSPDGRPVPKDEDDEAMQVEGQRKVQRGRYADVLCSVNVNMAKNDAAQVDEVRKWFGTATKNMRIRDYSLFVEVEKDV